MLLRLISHLRFWLAPKPTARRAPRTMLERLEDRIAPATFVSNHVVTYNDSDGDHVTITSSKPLFTAGNLSTILTFANGTGTNQQLQLIDLTSFGSNVVAGDNISITVQKVAGGDGFANVGEIDSQFGLGHVSIQGDLGRIVAGAQSGNSHYVGLTSLSVNTLGAQGVATQLSGGTLVSTIKGAIGSITVQQDMIGAEISAVSNIAGSGLNGNIGSVKIGGSLIGASGSNTGEISAAGSIGSIAISGDMQGGAGSNSAYIQAGSTVGSLSVNNIIGYTVANDTMGLGASSGAVVTGVSGQGTGTVGSIVVKGNIVGGDGSGSGNITESSISGSFASVKIGGALMGGSGGDSGELSANAFGSISIGKGIMGSSGLDSGSITTANGIKSLTILSGGITGGTDTGAGAVNASTAPVGTAVVGTVVIHGDIAGNAAAGSSVAGTAQIDAAAINSFTLYGSLVGSTAPSSGSVITSGALGRVSLLANGASKGSLLGGSGLDSGEISAATIGSVSMAGQIMGSGASSGRIITNNPNGVSSIGNVTIGGGIAGGTGDGSGDITAGDSANNVFGSLGSLRITGGGMTGGMGKNSGQVDVAGPIGAVTVAGGVTGGGGVASGVIGSGTAGIGAGFGSNLKSLSITGGITGGAGANSGQVAIGGTIGPVNLNGGAITAGDGAASGALLATDSVSTISLGSLISAPADGAGAGQISVGGNLTSLAVIGAGSSTTAVSGLVNISGSVGSISVHGDVAGAGNSTGLFVIGGGVKSFAITGALRGGTGTESGSIFAGLDDSSVIGSLTVSGGVIGGAGNGSGEVFDGGGITKAALGDLIGGGGQSSGSVSSDFALGSITVTGLAPGVTTHGVIGGAGADSGQISAGTTIGSVTVTGALQGAGGAGSGAILSHSTFTAGGDTQGDIGSVTITKSVTGGTGTDSGQIAAAGNLKTVSIGGSVTGALASGTGGIVAGTDLTGTTGGDIATLKIAGALQGAVVPAGAYVINGSGYIEAGHIGAISVGSVTAGSVGVATHVTNDGAILAANDIASLTVTGGVTGDYTNPVVISAVGEVTPGKTGDLAFGKISVGGAVSYANFLAGYDQNGAPVNGAAGIGSVTVGGNWAGSNLVAGVIAANGHFGDPHATLITTSATVIPTIASIIIKGQVTNALDVPFGGSDAADTYGFVAKKIDFFSLHGTVESLKNTQIDPVPGSTDAVLRDVT